MAVASGTIRSAIDFLQTGRAAQAQALLRRALQKDPGDANANHLLGLALSRLNQVQQAEYFLNAAVRISPADPTFHNALGNLLQRTGRSAQAADAYTRSIAADQQFYPGWIGLSAALHDADRYQDAADAASRAVGLNPDRFEGYDNLAMSQAEGGRIDEAVATLRRGLDAVPGSVPLLRNLLTRLIATEQEPSDATLELTRRLGSLVSTEARPTQPPKATPRSGPLKVGYLSPDLRTHSVAFFLEPILEHHDRSAFQACCYDAGDRPDETTARLKSHAAVWRVVTALDDPSLCRQIRSDGIDILIELAGHTVRSRAPVLAWACAPVQATYLGYAASTGIPAVHYRIVDALTDPPGSERSCTERLARPDGCFLCYREPTDAPPVEPRTPAAPVTFGSFNMLPKIGTPVIETWAAVLRATPGSSLLIKNRGLADARSAERLRAAFATLGVEPSRLRLQGPTPAIREHLGMYAGIDIALDTFPYDGTTTTCEALWMGVPVVALAGKTHAGRVGLSLLTAAGLPELVADSTDRYVRLVTQLAADAPRLATLRATLRDRLRTSPLMDGPGFTARFERVLRGMWEERCATGP